MPKYEETEVGDLKVTTTPLPFNASQPMLPEVAEFIGIAAQHIGPLLASGVISSMDKLVDPKVISQLAPVLVDIGKYFGSGRLDRLAPKVLATTTVIMKVPGGELETFELGKGKQYQAVFDEHPEAFLSILFFAGKVTFSRFFPGLGKAGKGTTAAES